MKWYIIYEVMEANLYCGIARRGHKSRHPGAEERIITRFAIIQKHVFKQNLSQNMLKLQ